MQINKDVAQASQQSAPKTQSQPQQQSIDIEIKQPQQIQPVKTSNSGQDNTGSGSEQSEKQDAIVKAATKEISSDSGGSVELEYTSLRFSVHERTNRVAVQIVDKASDQVIKEIPSEEVLDMLGKMWDAAGLFVDVQR